MLTFQYKKNTTPTFLEKIAIFDFDKYYVPKVRIFCHVTMWVVITILIQINLFFDYGLSFQSAIVFAGRSLICNTVVFYLFFYLVVPNTLYSNRIFIFILSIPVCFLLFIILNHYCIVIIGLFFNPNSPYLKKGIESNLDLSFFEIFAPRFILSQLITVIYSISIFFFIKILFDIVRYYSTVFKAERRASRLEIEKLNLESDFLKAQLNPHFLFNTLNNLYGLALKKDNHIPHIILQLSSIMRYTLYESNTEKVQLAEELAFIKNYVLLEKLRYKKEKRIVLDIDESNVHQQKIAPLLTFIFVENAFKYGLKCGNSSFIEIKISVTDKIFYFFINNDKEPFAIAKKDKEKGGIGIKNVKKRLELLYPGKYRLAIEDTEKNFGVTLQIEME